ncbi:MAG: inositol monophosphatase [Bacteroidia bacterium]|nr:inositol monophosphatase [Bacteroidia bacterium]
MNLKAITTEVCALAKETGQFILNERKNFSYSKVSDKGLNQLVSYVDIEAEKKIAAGLSKIVPEAGYITEENTQAENKDNTLVWVIDPLDGTTNFIHGLPVYSVSIALMQNGKTVSGVVYEINKDELFSAWKDGGAWLNGEKIQCSAALSLNDSLLATGFPYYDFKQMDEYLGVLRMLMRESHGLRRLGSAAVDLAYVACGRFEGFFEYGLAPWDVAAGVLIVEEAGGKVIDFQGAENYIFGKEIIACCAGIEAEFIRIVKEGFYKS